jgi:hypothetical protein
MKNVIKKSIIILTIIGVAIVWGWLCGFYPNKYIIVTDGHGKYTVEHVIGALYKYDFITYEGDFNFASNGCVELSKNEKHWYPVK